MKLNNNQISISGAILFKDKRNGRSFLVSKSKEGAWEIPKITVRRGESSVRAAIRMTGEQAGISAKVLEEAGRFNSTGTINGKSVAQKYYYYIMLYRDGSEDMLGFEDTAWLDYSRAVKKVELKREKEMLKQAKSVLKEWEKTHKVKNQ